MRIGCETGLYPLALRARRCNTYVVRPLRLLTTMLRARAGNERHVRPPSTLSCRATTKGVCGRGGATEMTAPLDRATTCVMVGATGFWRARGIAWMCKVVV